MNPIHLFFLSVLLILSTPINAEQGATLVIPEPKVWTGQRLPLFVELRAPGTYTGAASFDLPEIPGTVIIKVGNPILSSETEDDTEFFVQRHEFALFSQASGSLEVPPITARFSHKKGYSGPSFDTSTKTAPANLTIRRPPDSNALGFIVTSSSLDIKETWNPVPGPLETGAVLKRTIVQQASQLTGIALKPAPTPEIDGVRSYTGAPEVRDHTDRGEFSGERKDTITYLVQQPGLHTLPEIRYDWWNPTTETLESLTLPSVSFTATAPPPPPEKPQPARYLWLLVPGALIAVIFVKRRQLLTALRQLWRWIDPPPRRAKRALLRACRKNDPKAAAMAWNAFHRLRPDLDLSDELNLRIRELNSLLYGPDADHSGWSGDALAIAVSNLKAHQVASGQSQLPHLNP